MEFWTVMVITYGTAVFDAEASLIPYPNSRACGDAIEYVYGTLEETFPDMMIQCVPTDTASRLVYPKPRPAHLEGAW